VNPTVQNYINKSAAYDEWTKEFADEGKEGVDYVVSDEPRADTITSDMIRHWIL
jgi:hypothetical protein